MIRSATLLLASLLWAWSPGAASKSLLITDVTLIDPLTGATPDAWVAIADGRITDTGTMGAGGAGTALLPAADETWSAPGRYLIPGLWDLHVHFLYEPALTGSMAALFLDYGITSVRDTGGDLATMRALRARLATARVPAPRLYFAGPLLDGEHVVYDGATADRPPLGVPTPDVQTARERVRALHDAGADLIKIYELVSPDVFAALVREARRLELPIAAHVPLTMTADEAGPEVDSMEHLRNIELACARNRDALLARRRAAIESFTGSRGYELRRRLHAEQRLAAIAAYDPVRCSGVLTALRNTLQVPTLRLNTLAIARPFERPDWQGALAALPAEVANRWQARADDLTRNADAADPTFADWSRYLVARLNARGVPIGAGTDTPIGLAIPGYSLHTELEQLVDAGLTPLAALQAATVQGAAFFGMEAETGRVARGMQADLVLLTANPLTDIRNTRHIERVLLDGEWVR